jgi:hypothetical protein
MKTCTKCKSEKSLDLFHKDKSRKDGLRNWCKECVGVFMKNKHAENPAAATQRYNKWLEDPKNRAKHNLRCQKWVSENRGKVNARTARRYAAKTRATPKWVTGDVDLMWMINEVYELAQLRSRLTGFVWEVDHKTPLRGKLVMGLHVPWNLQVVPQKQNRVKSNKFEVAL